MKTDCVEDVKDIAGLNEKIVIKNKYYTKRGCYGCVTNYSTLSSGGFKNAKAFLQRGVRHALHDIFLLCTSAILPRLYQMECAYTDSGGRPVSIRYIKLSAIFYRQAA